MKKFILAVAVSFILVGSASAHKDVAVRSVKSAVKASAKASRELAKGSHKAAKASYRAFRFVF